MIESGLPGSTQRYAMLARAITGLDHSFSISMRGSGATCDTCSRRSIARTALARVERRRARIRFTAFIRQPLMRCDDITPTAHYVGKILVEGVEVGIACPARILLAMLRRRNTCCTRMQAGSGFASLAGWCPMRVDIDACYHGLDALPLTSTKPCRGQLMPRPCRVITGWMMA